MWMLSAGVRPYHDNFILGSILYKDESCSTIDAKIVDTGLYGPIHDPQQNYGVVLFRCSRSL